VKRVEGVEMRRTRRNPFQLTAMGTRMGKYTECRPTPTGWYRIRDDGKKEYQKREGRMTIKV
jgi:hypothetical protein